MTEDREGVLLRLVEVRRHGRPVRPRRVATLDTLDELDLVGGDPLRPHELLHLVRAHGVDGLRQHPEATGDELRPRGVPQLLGHVGARRTLEREAVFPWQPLDHRLAPHENDEGVEHATRPALGRGRPFAAPRVFLDPELIHARLAAESGDGLHGESPRRRVSPLHGDERDPAHGAAGPVRRIDDPGVQPRRDPAGRLLVEGEHARRGRHEAAAVRAVLEERRGHRPLQDPLGGPLLVRRSSAAGGPGLDVPAQDLGQLAGDAVGSVRAPEGLRRDPDVVALDAQGERSPGAIEDREARRGRRLGARRIRLSAICEHLHPEGAAGDDEEHDDEKREQRRRSQARRPDRRRRGCGNERHAAIAPAALRLRSSPARLGTPPHRDSGSLPLPGSCA